MIYFIILLITCIGFLRIPDLKNNDIADLFTPFVWLVHFIELQDSESHRESDIYHEYFTPSDDSFNIIAIPTRKGGILSNTDALLELLELEEKLTEITVEKKKFTGI